MDVKQLEINGFQIEVFTPIYGPEHFPELAYLQEENIKFAIAGDRTCDDLGEPHYFFYIQDLGYWSESSLSYQEVKDNFKIYAKPPIPESIKVLEECKELQLKKGQDYQNPDSSVKQADYYPNGCMTLLDIITGKVLRLRSVMEAMRDDPNYSPNFESLEDSFKDLINYSSFGVSYLRGKIDGQDSKKDFLNQEKERNSDY